MDDGGVSTRRFIMEAQVSVVGLDIAKSVFQVHGADATGKAVIRRKLRREEVEVFFRKLPPSLVALEACPVLIFGPDYFVT